MKKISVLCLSVVFSNSALFAQEQEINFPGIIETGTYEQKEKEEFRDIQAEKTALPDIEETKAPKGAKDVKFKLFGITVEDMTVYTEDEIINIYDEYISHNITLKELYEIANKITEKYRRDGYLLSKVIIPPQELIDGFVKFQAVEGFINDVDIDDKELSLKDKRGVEKVSSNLQTSAPTFYEDLERNLLLINDLYGVSAKSVIKPSSTEQKAADLMLEVKKDKYFGNITLDNYGTQETGEIRLSHISAFNGVFNGWDQLGLQVLTSENLKDFMYGELFYNTFVTEDGIKLNTSFSYGDTTPQDNLLLELLEVENQSMRGKIGLSYPAMRSRSDNLFIFGNFVYNEIQTDILGEEYSKDKITKFELGGQYAWRDNILWGGGIGKFNLTLHQGVDLFDATSEEDISSRINASSEFTKIVLEGERRQIIDENFSFVEAFKGQYSFEDNLLASEEFGIGGRNYLRGFDPSEELGEHGFALKLQVEYQDRIKSSMLKNYTLYTFAEYGKVYDDTGLDEEEIETELASVGLGAKFSLPLDFMFEAEVAKPIIGEVKTEGDDDARFFFSLSKNF